MNYKSLRNNFDRIFGILLVVGAMLFGTAKVFNYSFTDHLSGFSKSSYINLTTSNQSWEVILLNDNSEVHRFNSALPLKAFGKLSGYEFDRMILKTSLNITDNFRNKDIGLYSKFVVAHDYSWKINGKTFATSETHGYNRLFLPVSFGGSSFTPKVNIEFSMNTKDLEEPGLDLRGELIIGEENLVEKLSRAKSKADTIFSSWVIGVLLMLGLLLILTGLLDAYSLELNLLGIYCVLCALKTSIFFGGFELIDIGLSNRWATFNTLDLAGNALLFAFFAHFFRRDKKFRNKVFWGLMLLAATNLSLSIIFEGSYKYVSYVYEASNTLLYIITTYGLFSSASTFWHLKKTGLSRIRLYISLTISIAMAVVTPALFWAQNSTGVFWIALPSFQVGFNLFIASLIAIDHGTVKRDRSIIWKKMASTVDRSALEAILTNDHTHRKWIDNAVIMFIDLKGFTNLCESHDAKSVSEHLSIYYDIVVRAVHSHGGMVDKFIGDGVMAAWGATGSEEFDISSPVKAAFEILQSIDNENSLSPEARLADFELGIGIHCGKVCAGIIGNKERAEFTVIGSPANIASRLESQSRHTTDRIILSNDYYRQVRDKITVHETKEVQLKGLESPIRLVTTDLRALGDLKNAS